MISGKGIREFDLMEIRKAKPEEFDSILSFYYTLIDDMQNAVYHPGWQKDIYPDPEELAVELSEGSLYCGFLDGEIVSSMAVNHKFQDDAYAEAKWGVEADAAEVLVIHMLGVGTKHGGRGYAKQMVRFAIDLAERSGMKAVRLDVMKGNLPAERLYPAMGFSFCGMIPMYYPDVGWMEFGLYEYQLL